MVTECVAILAISLCLVVVFIRAGHGDYAASVTPILAVPFVHLLALPVSWWTDSLFPALAPQSVVAFADIAAVVVSCLMIMSFSGKIRNRRIEKAVCSDAGWIQYYTDLHICPPDAGSALEIIL